MDQGDAEIWAAGITGLLTTASGPVAARCAYLAGRRQAQGMVDGVRLQLSGEWDFALWSDRRAAYASFVTKVESIRMDIDHATALFSAWNENVPVPSSESFPDVRLRLNERTTDLLASQSVLGISIDGPEAAAAKHLVGLAMAAIAGLDAYVSARAASG